MTRPDLPRPTLPVTEALARSEPLVHLLQRVRDSEARWQAVRGELPPGLAGQVRAGPLDDAQWTLLARSGAAAGKLRQCLPRLQATLQAAGWPERPIRVKVHGVQTG